ncbi:DUF3599 family protein [Jeotgalibacillus malaysiensis]|uniref:DUF3599 family protein n=1 Tax=Jeotgalibacillus malaysiensis TaxID=1508404 RepID=UPI00384A48A0
MSYENLLTDRCDIYYLKMSDREAVFGVPADNLQKDYKFDELPDLKDVKCYFTENNQSISQADPERSISQSFKVHFQKHIALKVNSRVIWNGIAYRMQVPRMIKNHHQEVLVVREVERL